LQIRTIGFKPQLFGCGFYLINILVLFLVVCTVCKSALSGIATLWTENKIYADYGGSSLNLQQFWKNVKEGKMTYEQAALNTFTGKWAKENGFSKVRIKNQGKDIMLDEVRLVILKIK